MLSSIFPPLSMNEMRSALAELGFPYYPVAFSYRSSTAPKKKRHVSSSVLWAFKSLVLIPLVRNGVSFD